MHEGPKQAWLKALRSGEFAQGKRVLIARDDDEEVTRYCCLGVACILAMNAGVDLSLEFEPAGAEIDVDDDTKEVGVHEDTPIGVFVSSLVLERMDGGVDIVAMRDAELLPRPVQEWLGLADNNPDVATERQSLAGLNDQGRTFAEIADIIERDL